MRLSVPLSFALLAACTPVSEPRHLVFDSTALTATLRVGDTARVIMDVRNVSSAPIHVGPRNCNGDFVLVSASGAIFYPAALFPCNLALVAPQEVAPGASVRLTGMTNGIVVSERPNATAQGIAPGRYEVRSTVTPVDAGVSAISIQVHPATLVFLSHN